MVEIFLIYLVRNEKRNKSSQIGLNGWRKIISILLTREGED